MQHDEDRSSNSAPKTDQPGAGQAQPDPKKMQTPPLRGPTSAGHGDQEGGGGQQRKDRGSPNVHMEPGHENDPAATDSERPKFDR
jgi:hypothetical protein